jgi:hypothetical protein
MNLFKMSPERILPVLKTFGIDVNTILPKLENALINFWQKKELEAQSKLMMLLSHDEHNNFSITFYKTENGQDLSIYKTYSLQQLINLIKDGTNTNRKPARFASAGTADYYGDDFPIEPELSASQPAFE